MGYTSIFTGNIAYDHIADQKIIDEINDFIEINGRLDRIVAEKHNLDFFKRNQFADNVNTLKQRMHVHIEDRKSYFFKEFLQEIVNHINSLGYNVLNVYIERQGEHDDDFETFTLVGNTILSNSSNLE